MRGFCCRDTEPTQKPIDMQPRRVCDSIPAPLLQLAPRPSFGKEWTRELCATAMPRLWTLLRWHPFQPCTPRARGRCQAIEGSRTARGGFPHEASDHPLSPAVWRPVRRPHVPGLCGPAPAVSLLRMRRVQGRSRRPGFVPGRDAVGAKSPTTGGSPTPTPAPARRDR